MRKEGLTQCGFCHVKPGGGGARNYRGLYYAMHGHSFAGFDDAAEAKAAGVEVGPDASEKPASLTPPAAAATPAPAAPATPKSTAPATPAKKAGSAAAADKAHAAKVAYTKSMTPKNKAAYAAAMASLSSAYLAEKKNADAATAAKSALALDPKNATAKANLAAATKKK